MSPKTLVLFALATIFLAPAEPSAAAAVRAGEVLAIFGNSVISGPGQQTPLKLGDPVHVGDTIEVADGAKLKLRMIDGSVIAAGSGSHLTIDAYSAEGGNRDAKLGLAAGLLRAAVTTAGTSSSFEVNTATGVAAVRSTDWFIEAKSGSTQVGVLSGVVDLASRATGRDVRIPARWGARVETGMDPIPPHRWKDSEFDDVISRTDLQ